MRKFRQDWAPRVIIKPGMHYNYSSLQHAFELLEHEWDNLYRASDNNYDKIRLVWRQLIGFEMRRLPGIDRCFMAKGLDYVLDHYEDYNRSYKFKRSDGSFPITHDDDSLVGLGGDFAVNVWYGVDVEARGGFSAHTVTSFGKFMSNRNIKLAELMQPHPAYQQTGCVML